MFEMYAVNARKCYIFLQHQVSCISNIIIIIMIIIIIFIIIIIVHENCVHALQIASCAN